MSKNNEELRRFAEAMLDLDRLKIVGELAKGNRAIQVLSTEVELTPEQVLSHLRVLSLTGVVFERNSESGEPVYAIDSVALERMSHRQFARQRARKKNEPDLRKIGPNFSPREAQIIRSITFKDGRVRVIPGANKVEKVKALVHYAMQFVELDRTYTESEIGQLLSAITNDPASIRRYAVDLGYLNRTRDGASYWKEALKDE